MYRRIERVLTTSHLQSVEKDICIIYAETAELRANEDMSELSEVSLMLFLYVFRARFVLAAVSLLKRHDLDEEGVEAASRRRRQP